jgi:hypothetical protein
MYFQLTKNVKPLIVNRNPGENHLHLNLVILFEEADVSARENLKSMIHYLICEFNKQKYKYIEEPVEHVWASLEQSQ